MDNRRCASCHKLFHPRPQSPGQKFCSATECQKERKRWWQKARRAADQDFPPNLSDEAAYEIAEFLEALSFALNATGAGQTSAASQDLARMSTELLRLIDQFRV